MLVSRTHYSLSNFLAMLMLLGFLIVGPYSLITTAVSTDLGTHQSLRGNSKALATVVAIIDGTGSLGNSVEFSWCFLPGFE